MTVQDFSKRLVIVVRKDLEGWQAANAIAHIAAFVGNKLGDSFGTGDTFVLKDGYELPRNSQYPMIIKSAESSQELADVLQEARNTSLMTLGFVREMIDCESDAELQGLLETKTQEEVEFLGVGMFGENDTIKALTKKFPLWK